MKVFIRDQRIQKEIFIYGIDGDEKTLEFFRMYFIDDPTIGIYETTEEERMIYNTDAVITFSDVRDYNAFARVINVIQEGIDAVAEAQSRGEDIEDYTIDSLSYII